MPRSRGASSYARRLPIKEPYETALIVCEGDKTEPVYFSRLRAVHQLSSANVRILHPDGTDPLTIVTVAEQEFSTGEFDKVFCVFDRDGHEGYAAALNRIAQSGPGRQGKIIGVTSWPCFEFWVLLHFTYTAAPFERIQGVSSCDRVVSEVRRHMPNYAKAASNTFDILRPRLPDALRHAKQLVAENQRTGSSNPATHVHKLVEYLTGLKGR